MDAYARFLQGKVIADPVTGMTDIPELSLTLKPHKRDIVRWALRRGRHNYGRAKNSRNYVLLGSSCQRGEGTEIFVMTGYVSVCPPRECMGFSCLSGVFLTNGPICYSKNKLSRAHIDLLLTSWFEKNYSKTSVDTLCLISMISFNKKPWLISSDVVTVDEETGNNYALGLQHQYVVHYNVMSRVVHNPEFATFTNFSTFNKKVWISFSDGVRGLFPLVGYLFVEHNQRDRGGKCSCPTTKSSDPFSEACYLCRLTPICSQNCEVKQPNSDERAQTGSCNTRYSTTIFSRNHRKPPQIVASSNTMASFRLARAA